MTANGKRLWLGPAVAACLLMVASGAGFAALTATATVHGQATPATFGLVVTSVSEVAGPSWIVIKTTHLPASVVSVWVNETTPSALVNLSVVVQNIGTVPAQNVTYVFTTTLHGPSSCSIGTYMYPSGPNIPPGAILDPGVSFPSYWELQAGPHLSSCAGHVFFSFTIAFTASAGY